MPRQSFVMACFCSIFHCYFRHCNHLHWASLFAQVIKFLENTTLSCIATNIRNLLDILSEFYLFLQTINYTSTWKLSFSSKFLKWLFPPNPSPDIYICLALKHVSRVPLFSNDHSPAEKLRTLYWLSLPLCMFLDAELALEYIKKGNDFKKIDAIILASCNGKRWSFQERPGCLYANNEYVRCLLVFITWYFFLALCSMV